MTLSGKHVLVLGLGESGLASALGCLRQGARVRVADTRAAPPYLDELRRCGVDAGADSRLEFIAGEFDKALLDGIDLLVLSQRMGLSEKLDVLARLHAALGERRIDLTIARDESRPFVRLAKAQGVRL